MALKYTYINIEYFVSFSKAISIYYINIYWYIKKHLRCEYKYMVFALNTSFVVCFTKYIFKYVYT